MKVAPPRDPSPLTLDERQAEAASMRTPGIVLGGPGSGKTTVLVERAVHLLDSGVPRDEILLLAVSRQTSDDLSRRLVARLGTSIPAVATFHNFAFNLVKNHHRAAGYRHAPRFLGASELWEELKRALAREDRRRWPRYGNSLRARSLLALLNDLLAGAANNDLSQEEAEQLLERRGRPDLVELANFASRFEEYLKGRCLLDSERAVVESLHLLQDSDDLISTYQLRFPHILVDQFEDATYVQARLAQLLGGTRLFVTGNPLQGINSYRGGSPAYLQELASSPWVHVIRLKGCYRPAQTEMSPEEKLFSNGVARGPVPRRSSIGSENADTETEPGLLAFPNGSAAFAGTAGHRAPSYSAFRYQSEESTWITQQITRLLRSGTAPASIAAIFRTGSDPLARDLAGRLARAGIPVSSAMGAASVGSDSMVAAAVDILRFLSAPAEERLGLFLKLIGSPLGGLTRAEVRLLDRAARDAKTSVIKLAGDPAAESLLPGDIAAAVTDFADRLARLDTIRTTAPDELLWQLWATFPAFARQVNDVDAVLEYHASSSATYRAFLDEVARIVHDYGSTSITDIVRLYDEGHFHAVAVISPHQRAGITLATVHQARNREWQHVFLPNLVEAVYPLKQSPVGNLAPMLLRAGTGEPDDVHERHLAEERRIFYVALSRAVEQIYLTHSNVAFDGTTELAPSRYLSTLGLNLSVQCWPASLPASTAMEITDLAAHFRRQLREPDPLRKAQALYALDAMARRFPVQTDPAHWWDNIDVTEGAAPAYPAASLHLSASRLSSYRDCPLAFKFGQHLKLEEISGDSMSLGSLLHDVLEAYHAPGSLYPRTRDALEVLADEKYKPEQFSRPPIAAQARRRLSELLDLYFSRYGTADGVVAVETPFRFNLGPHTVNGRIDRIDRRQDGTLELIDYKSGGAMTQAEAERDIQLGLYGLAFEHVPELAALGTPGRATYLYVKHIGPRADGRRSYQPTEEGRQRLLDRIDRYSGGILAETFPSRFGILDTWTDLAPDEVERIQKSDPCRNCSFKWLCPDMERGVMDA